LGPLADDFIAEDGPGGRHVEGPDLAPHGDRDQDIARPGDQRTQPFTLAAEDQAEGATEVGGPGRDTALGGRAVDPYT
jgi:hypothetical protein